MKQFQIINQKTNQALFNLGYEDSTMTVASFENNIRKKCGLGSDVQIVLFTAVNALNQTGPPKALATNALMRDHLPYDGKIYIDPRPITEGPEKTGKQKSYLIIQDNLVSDQGLNNNVISKDLKEEEGITAKIVHNETKGNGTQNNAILGGPFDISSFFKK